MSQTSKAIMQAQILAAAKQAQAKAIRDHLTKWHAAKLNQNAAWHHRAHLICVFTLEDVRRELGIAATTYVLKPHLAHLLVGKRGRELTFIHPKKVCDQMADEIQRDLQDPKEPAKGKEVRHEKLQQV